MLCGIQPDVLSAKGQKKADPKVGFS